MGEDAFAEELEALRSLECSRPQHRAHLEAALRGPLQGGSARARVASRPYWCSANFGGRRVQRP
eukprot:9893912-Alexandrium_andersonii.AAC.1